MSDAVPPAAVVVTIVREVLLDELVDVAEEESLLI